MRRCRSAFPRARRARAAVLGLVATLAFAGHIAASQPPCQPPVITDHPDDVTVTKGQRAELLVRVEGTEPLAYRWFESCAGAKEHRAADGDDARILTAEISTTTCFWVRVKNPCGEALSTIATITVNSPPVISDLDATPATVRRGQTSNLTARLSDEDNDVLSWRFAIDASSTGSATLSADSGFGNAPSVWLTAFAVGRLVVDLSVADGHGHTTSRRVVLTVVE